MNSVASKKVLLVIEDDMLLREALVTKLSRAGYAVITAQRSDDALEIALAKHPDLVTLDILLPDKRGDVFMDAIRKDSWGASVPIVVLTNFDADNTMIDKINKDHPSYYFIRAQTDMQFLVEKISELLTEKDTPSQTTET